MHAASREALAALDKHLDTALFGIDNGVAVAAQAGAEIFDVVEVLDADRALRVAVADSSAEASQRSGLMSAVFGGKVSDFTAGILTFAAAQTWSTPREMRAGLVACGRRAMLRSAEHQGQLGQVESELFQLSRILDKQPQLTQLLSDRTATPAAKRDLLAKVLYGKVTAVTEALALQAIGRPERNPIDDMASLADTVAALQGRQVASVVAASALNAGQVQALEEKLGRIYGRAMSIHTEVDPSLLGGMVIRVGDEVIDGSTSGKLERMRTVMA
ncbi:F0F1 ATP synthase subunit delta [Corynebacterium aquilae]|uniref:ATP synthase subunit delta n=1 Tax=Corynebacterium aquilae DSM 44791 TaxID=1431546 RepID=A0A1L7CFD9_9CORY|nr:F0F1 ATP synthase subunit delta [Corynebacterium aquilae]APT84559.1 ATP F0F1 synthase subunit delta [Corynebacterium aquilae DSM 44791]